MSRSRTLTNLIADVRMRTNQEASTFVTDAEITEYLNQELAELWTRLVLSQSQPLYRSQTTISVVPPTSLYALPADFLAIQGAQGTLDGYSFTLRPFMPHERPTLQTTSQLYGPVGPIQYRVQGDNIEFLPCDRAFDATVYYAPSQPRLVSGSDTFDGFNGFEMCAIAGVCAVVMAKEESDPSFYLGLKNRFYATAEKAAAFRDMSSPERVQDVEDFGYASGWGGNTWWPR